MDGRLPSASTVSLRLARGGVRRRLNGRWRAHALLIDSPSVGRNVYSGHQAGEEARAHAGVWGGGGGGGGGRPASAARLVLALLNY